MSVEFIGYAGHFNVSETVCRAGPAIDLDFIEAVAKAQESPSGWAQIKSPMRCARLATD